VIGSNDHPDFAAASALLANSADVATGDVTATLPPDLVLICQVHPHAVLQHTVEQLRRHLRDTPIAVLLGSWCEGETRTGRPWAGVERVYWYQFPSWWERFARTQQVVPPPGTRDSKSVLIDCPYHETFQALADTLPEGCASVWLTRGLRWPLTSGAVSGIWVGGQLSDTEFPSLQRFARIIKARHGRLVAMLDFPRHDRVACAFQLGAAAELGMPWRREELCHALGVTLPATSLKSTAEQRDAA
jgi:hypothetical protein